MGLLSIGQPLSWAEIKKYRKTIKDQGILQFITTYNKLKDRKTPCLMWGDELEFMLIAFDETLQKAKVLLKGETIIDQLTQKSIGMSSAPYIWHPEFASYMVEGTPGEPYKGTMSHFNVVESNMNTRRLAIREVLKSNETVLTVTSFPRLGCKDFSEPYVAPTPDRGKMRSLYISDKAANNSHPRFLTLAENIRSRKGRKVYINLPIYRDIKTPDPFKENFEELGYPVDLIAESKEVALPNHVYMDAMCFGMGCCCLQVTFQACNIEEARYLYDQLGALCPIMLALTAASPIYKGFLVDRDCRWDVIAGSVDDRTKQELGLLPSDGPVIRKSRYDSIDCYISYMGKPYNDIPLLYDQKYCNQLIEAGVDELLAQHIAHLFIRDPVILYEEDINQSPDNIDHFENIQSTNWQTMRFKPPPPDTNIGWRVEFRPQEIQLTDFENAAYVVFVVLLTRVILSYNLNFLIPISKMEKNMVSAQKRNAVLDEKFWFHFRNFSKKRDVIEKEGAIERRESEKQLQIQLANLQKLNELHEQALAKLHYQPSSGSEHSHHNSHTDTTDDGSHKANGFLKSVINNNNNNIYNHHSSHNNHKNITPNSVHCENCQHICSDRNFDHIISPTSHIPSQKNTATGQIIHDSHNTSPSALSINESFNFRASSPHSTISDTTTNTPSFCINNPVSELTSLSSDCTLSYNEDDWRRLSINEIVNGNQEFPGLVPLVKNFLNNMDLDVNTRCTIHKYLRLIEKRASGQIPTIARWMRDFVTSHPDYKGDSRVSELTNYDLIKLCDRITKGELPCPYFNTDVMINTPNSIIPANPAPFCCNSTPPNVAAANSASQTSPLAI